MYFLVFACFSGQPWKSMILQYLCQPQVVCIWVLGDTQNVAGNGPLVNPTWTGWSRGSFEVLSNLNYSMIMSFSIRKKNKNKGLGRQKLWISRDKPVKLPVWKLQNCSQVVSLLIKIRAVFRVFGKNNWFYRDLCDHAVFYWHLLIKTQLIM